MRTAHPIAAHFFKLFRIAAVRIAVVIVSSTLYILLREARVGSKPPPPMVQE